MPRKARLDVAQALDACEGALQELRFDSRLHCQTGLEYALFDVSALELHGTKRSLTIRRPICAKRKRKSQPANHHSVNAVSVGRYLKGSRNLWAVRTLCVRASTVALNPFHPAIS